MANKDLGTKQLCPSCEVKFYDLNKRPAICPKCGATFDPEDDAVKAKAKAAAKAPAKKAKDPEDEEDTGADGETSTDEDEEEDPEAAKELGGDVDEVVLEGDDTADEDDNVGPGKVPAGFSEEGADDDETDDDAAILDESGVELPETDDDIEDTSDKDET
ncbi:MAG: TIGR02300 family protein [Hyphomonadaceae bacterium]